MFSLSLSVRSRKQIFLKSCKYQGTEETDRYEFLIKVFYDGFTQKQTHTHSDGKVCVEFLTDISHVLTILTFPTLFPAIK